MWPVLPGFLRPEAVPDQQHRATGDGRVGDVEGRPVLAIGMKIEEIDHRAEQDAVDHVAERTRQHQAQRQAEQLLLPDTGAADR